MKFLESIAEQVVCIAISVQFGGQLKAHYSKQQTAEIVHS